MSDTDALHELIAEHWNHGQTWEVFVAYARKNADTLAQNYDAAEVADEAADAIRAIRGEFRVLILGADWCGDVVANVPPLAKFLSLNSRIQLRILDRDRHDDLMGHVLTNGGKAIPKAIAYRPDFSVLRMWGPRPAPAQAIMNELKGQLPKEEILPKIKAWYAQDSHRTLHREFLEVLRG